MAITQQEPKKITIGIAQTPQLPNTYQEVEYIESSGTQVLETDVTLLTHPFKVEVKYMKQNTETSDQTLVGQRQIGKYVNIYNNYYENLWSSSAAGTASGDDDVHTIITDSSAGLYKDGTLLVSGTSGNRSSSYPLLMFAFSEDSYSNAKWYAKVRIYEVKITSNNALYRHYIPCYRKNDSVIGMYETVTGTFLTNKGTGTFTKGANISYNDTPMKAIYIGSTQVRPNNKLVYDFTTQDILTFRYRQNSYTGYGWTSGKGYYSQIQNSSYYRTNTAWEMPNSTFKGTLEIIKLEMNVPNEYSGGGITTDVSSNVNTSGMGLGNWDSNNTDRMNVWGNGYTYDYSPGIQTLVMDFVNSQMYVDGNSSTPITISDLYKGRIMDAWNNKTLYLNIVANLPNGSGPYTYLRRAEFFIS